jgi:hypothetical protein
MESSKLIDVSAYMAAGMSSELLIKTRDKNSCDCLPPASTRDMVIK